MLTLWHGPELPFDNRQPSKALKSREHEPREQIPHTWASSNDSFFKSNFSARSCRAVILRKVADWSALINDIFKCRV